MRYLELISLLLILVGCTPINQTTKIVPSETKATSAAQTFTTQPIKTYTVSLTDSPTKTNTPAPIFPPPAGLIYRSSDNVWIVNQNGEKELMVTNITPDIDGVPLCSTGE